MKRWMSEREKREIQIRERSERLLKLWAMNQHLQPEFEETFEGLRYWQSIEHPEVFGA